MFCGKCGSEIKSDHAYCPVCGNALPMSSGHMTSSPESISSPTVGLTKGERFVQILLRVLLVYLVVLYTYELAGYIIMLSDTTINRTGLAVISVCSLLIYIAYLFVILINKAFKFRKFIIIALGAHFALGIVSSVYLTFFENSAYVYKNYPLSFHLIWLFVDILLSSKLYLFIGAVTRKHTEKIAGVIIFVGFIIVSIRDYILIPDTFGRIDSILSTFFLIILPSALVYLLYPVISEPLPSLKRQ